MTTRKRHTPEQVVRKLVEVGSCHSFNTAYDFDRIAKLSQINTDRILASFNTAYDFDRLARSIVAHSLRSPTGRDNTAPLPDCHPGSYELRELLGPGRSRTTPVRALGDKAYSSRANRQFLRQRGIQAVIPERSDQIANRQRRGSKGGRPVSYDTEAYKRRNVVERSFNIFKQWRALATRYDKLALTYRGGVILRAITIWLRALR